MTAINDIHGGVMIKLLRQELKLSNEARDMYKYVFTCAKEVKDLDESTGVPIKGGSRRIAKDSLYHVINEVEEWEND